MIGLATNYITEFDVAAIILTIMLLFMLFIRRTFPTLAIKLYSIILICNLISSAADLASAYTIYNPGLVPLQVNYAINMAFLLAHNITSVFFMMYVISNIRRNLGTKAERILWIVLMTVLAVVILTTPITKGVFYFDDAGVYNHGDLMIVLYVIPAIAIFYSVYLLIKYRKILSSFQLGTNFAFIIFVIASIAFQISFPTILIENFTIAIACLMMNVALDNPSIYFYKNTTCYNQSAFNASIERKISNGSEIALIAFTFEDVSVIRKGLSESEYEELILSIIRRSHRSAGRKNVFILQDEVFVVIHENSNLYNFIKNLESQLTRVSHLTTGNEVSVNPHFSVLQLPGEVKTANDVSLVLHDTLTHIYRKTGEHIIWDSTKLLKDIRREDEVVHFLRHAIRNDGITVLFQPMFNVKTGKFNRAEALVRLRDNSISAYPDEFIPIAEANGLITDIGAIVLDRVCRFMQESGAGDFGIERINVNLSMLQLVKRSEVERLVNICQNYGIEPHQIVLEVTETATQGDGSEDVHDNIKYLKQLGFALSLDDYGSGYSNMDNLVRFSFDQIKVDKTLLWSAVNDEQSKAVLKNVIKLVQNLEKECVVEGIENESMEELLRSLGVDYLQGFKYSRPISDLALIKFLKDHNRDI